MKYTKKLFFALFMGITAIIGGAYGVNFSISGGDSSGSGSVSTNMKVPNSAAVNGMISINGATVTPQTSISGPVSNFEETHGVSDTSTGKSAQVYVKVVNAPSGLTYASKVLPSEGKVGAQKFVSAEQWLTVPSANSITCTESASYGTTKTSVSLDKATSVSGYYGLAYADDATVNAMETGHVKGPFIGTATVGTNTKTRTPNYGSEYDLTMTAIKGSAPSGTLGYYVNPTLKIQGAVDAAQSGDTVNVAAGTYKENVKIVKSLNVKGAGADKTIVDGNKAGSVFKIGSESNWNFNVGLSGMTIQNGVGSTTWEFGPNWKVGGGVLNYGGTLTLDQVTITKNTADRGGGVFNWGDTYMKSGSIDHNSAQFGGGVQSYGIGTFYLSGGNVQYNTANFGGGILNDANTALIMSGGSVDHNSVQMSGGGVASWGSITQTGGSISYNTASNPTVADGAGGGGIYNDYAGTVKLMGGSVDHNSATYGGGLYTDYGGSGTGVITISGGLVSTNSALFGGGIYNGQGATVNLVGSAVSNNIATKSGGGIYNDAGTVNMNGGSIASNTADIGGAICNDVSGRVNLNSGSIDHNTANSGGGIGNFGVVTLSGGSINSNKATYSGGGILNYGGSTVNLNSGSIDHNTANSGGGIRNVGALTGNKNLVHDNSPNNIV